MRTMTEWEPRVMARRTIGNTNRIISETRDYQYLVIDFDMVKSRVKKLLSYPTMGEAKEAFNK